MILVLEGQELHGESKRWPVAVHLVVPRGDTDTPLLRFAIAISSGLTLGDLEKIERKTHEDVAFRVIAGGAHPDHSSVSEFRRVHLDALADLFVQALQLCQAAGMVKLGHVALDGTKVRANASKHKAMSAEPKRWMTVTT